MKILILHALPTDAGKCSRVAEEHKKKQPDDAITIYNITFTPLPDKPQRVRFSEASMVFLGEVGAVDMLIWLGHAGKGFLSAEGATGGCRGAKVSLNDIVTAVSMLTPRVVTFFACSFGVKANKTFGGNLAGGPYQEKDSFAWIANSLGLNLKAERRLVLNASTTSVMVAIMPSLWFAEAPLDRHFIVRDGKVLPEVAYYQVAKLLNAESEKEEEKSGL